MGGDRTETAPDSDVATRGSGPLDSVLGRYRLEGQLGEGGMGVVLAAFDPDLERRVALKILHVGTDAPEARTRLLNEARAMARLTHENVATVYEVGTAKDRDYIAMELIEGETLEDWLQHARSPREIIHAFLAAGRGLSAAHSAGVVHRDFKPHNVLRRKDGRIVVSDFGLARDVDVAVVPGVADMTDDRQALNTPSRLAGLTRAGSVLGTPAYMAPEQWTGGPVGPAADQFAFCVALWEALAKERPFAVSKIEPLRRAAIRTRVDQEGATAPTVTAGADRITVLGLAAAFKRDLTSTLDDSKIPRHLRKLLRRGLDPDPANRWTSMDALLAAITRAERQRVIRFALVVAAGVAGAAGLVAGGVYLVHGEALTCRPPDKDPSKVWGDKQQVGIDLATRLGSKSIRAMLDADMKSWSELRDRACKIEMPVEEHPRLLCLDAVINRMDVAIHAASLVRGLYTFDLGRIAVDPRLCDTASPPLLLRYGLLENWEPVLLAILQNEANDTSLAGAEGEKLLALSADDPCAKTIARTAKLAAEPNGGAPGEADALARSLDLCLDEHLGFDAARAIALDAIRREAPATEIAEKVKNLEDRLTHTPQRDLEGDVDIVRSMAAALAGNLDEAIRRAERAADLYAVRYRTRLQLAAALRAIRLREIRLSHDDIVALPGLLARWRDFATNEFHDDDPGVLETGAMTAEWKLWNGDLAGAHAAFDAQRSADFDVAVAVHGRLVDDTGKPVAGATVWTGRRLRGTSRGAAVGDPFRRTATTRADGSFELAEGVPGGTIVAELGDRRSAAIPITPEVALTLAPTSRLEGHIELHGVPPQTVHISVHAKGQPANVSYELIAPVAADGSFALDGVPRGPIVIDLVRARATKPMITTTELDVKQPIVKELRLDLGER